jgi:hypothetical protein
MRIYHNRAPIANPSMLLDQSESTGRAINRGAQRGEKENGSLLNLN